MNFEDSTGEWSLKTALDSEADSEANSEADSEANSKADSEANSKADSEADSEPYTVDCGLKVATVGSSRSFVVTNESL